MSLVISPKNQIFFLRPFPVYKNKTVISIEEDSWFPLVSGQAVLSSNN